MSVILQTNDEPPSLPNINASVFSQGPVVVFRWRQAPHWPVEFVTSNVHDLFGYTEDELVSGEVHYRDIVHPQDWKRVANEVTQQPVGVTGQCRHASYRVVTKTGDVRWVEHFSAVECDADSQAIGYAGYVLDITDRKTAELDMLAMLDAVPDLMFKVNQNGIFVDYHARQAGNLALPPEAFLGKRMLDVLPEPVAQEGMDHLKRALRSGTTSTHEYSLLTVNGSVRDFEARYVAKGDNEALVIVRDITENKQAEDALRKRNTQLNLIAEQLHAVFWAVDRGLRFTMSHGAGLRKLGLLPHEVIGMSIFDYFQTSDPEFPPVASIIQALSGRSVSFDLEWHDVTYQSFVEPIHDERGEVVGAVGISLDVTDRKMSERRLTESETRFKDIAESMSDWVWEVDARGVYTYCSERIEDILGYRPEEIIGRTPFDFMPEDEARKNAAEFAEICDRKAPIKNLENWSLAKDGRRVCLLTNGIPLFDSAGDLAGYRGVDTDITERKLTMEALVQAKEEAEVASRAKSQFLSRMSHELRTPLNAILGYSELMMETDEEPITENQCGILNTIHEAGDHLLALINEVLDLARIETGKMEVSPHNVQWRELIDQCIVLTGPAAHHKQVQLKVDAEPAVPQQVYADPQRLKQVLLNLISNAVKYNRAGGEAVIRVIEACSGQLRFEIRDTGIGLSERQIGQLFQPFKRLVPDNGLLEGVGIGLVISKHLVELMGGTIGVDSVVDKGSVFWFTLPIREN